MSADKIEDCHPGTWLGPGLSKCSGSCLICAALHCSYRQPHHGECQSEQQQQGRQQQQDAVWWAAAVEEHVVVNASAFRPLKEASWLAGSCMAGSTWCSFMRRPRCCVWAVLGCSI